MTPETARAIARMMSARERAALDSLLLFPDDSDIQHAERLKVKPATFRGAVFIAKGRLRCQTRLSAVMEWQKISKQLLQQSAAKTV